MHFLHPGYLWALFALAIPLVVHLFNLQRSEKVIFSNTRMLESLVKQTSKARNLRHLLLLLLRLLAMACIILAFAQPVTSGPEQGLTNGISAISTYIDNSPSMALPGAEGSGLERAIAFSNSIPSLFSEKGWFRLNDNASGAGHSWTSAGGFHDQILEVQKVSASKDLQTVLHQSYRQFSLRSGDEKKHLFIVSDFQKGFLNDFRPQEIDSNITHHFYPVAHEGVSNLWIDSAWTMKNPEDVQDNTSIFFRIRSSGLEEKKLCRVQLFEGNNLQAGKQLEIRPDQDQTAVLQLRNNGNKGRFLRIEIEDPACAWDNSFYLSLKSAAVLRVHSIGNEANPVLKKLFESSNNIQAGQSRLQNPDYTALETCDLLVLDKVSGLSEALTSRIIEHLNTDKALCIIPPRTSGSGFLLPGILNSAAPLLPEPVKGESKERITQPGPENSFFKSAFRDPGRNPLLPEARPLLNIENQGFPLLRFESGKVFLSSFPVGAGMVFLYSSDPSDIQSSFHRHPLMLASFFRMAASARPLQSGTLFESRNQDRVFLQPDSGFLPGEGQVELRNGKHKVLAGLGNSGKNYFVQVNCDALPEGFWEVFQNGKRIDAFALNQSGEESKTSFFSAEEIKTMLPEKPWIKVMEIEKNAKQEHLKAGLDQGFSWWKILILMAVLFLVLETGILRTTRKTKNAAA